MEFYKIDKTLHSRNAASGKFLFLFFILSRIVILFALAGFSGSAEFSDDTSLVISLLNDPLQILQGRAGIRVFSYAPFFGFFLFFPFKILNFFLSDFYSIRCLAIGAEALSFWFLTRILSGSSNFKKGLLLWTIAPMTWMSSVVMAQDEVFALPWLSLSLLLVVRGQVNLALLICGLGVVVAKIFLLIPLLILILFAGEIRWKGFWKKLAIGAAPVLLTYVGLWFQANRTGSPFPLVDFNPEARYGVGWWTWLKFVVHSEIFTLFQVKYGSILVFSFLSGILFIQYAKKLRESVADLIALLTLGFYCFFVIFYQSNPEYFVLVFPGLVLLCRSGRTVTGLAVLSALPWVTNFFYGLLWAIREKGMGGKLAFLHSFERWIHLGSETSVLATLEGFYRFSLETCVVVMWVGLVLGVVLFFRTSAMRSIAQNRFHSSLNFLRAGWTFLWNRPKRSTAPLDGLRALAILMVIFQHSLTDYGSVGGEIEPFRAIPLLRGGWTGVDLFFVLSGFLIGTQLIQEFQKTGTLSVGRFLLRRTLRIWPLYFVSIFLLLLLFKPWQPRIVLWPDLTFLSNYFPGNRPGGFLDGSWSIAIEEQFYVLIPVLLGVALFVGRGSFQRVKNYLILLLVSAPIIRFGIWSQNMRFSWDDKWMVFSQIHYPLYTHYDGLVMGVILACAYSAPPDLESRPRGFLSLSALGLNSHTNGWRSLLGIGGWVLGAVVLRFIHPVVFTYTALALFYGACVWFVLKYSTPLSEFLSARIFYFLARISFGMYLFHRFFLESIARKSLNLLPKGWAPLQLLFVFLGALVAAMGMALIAFLLIEYPILKWRKEKLS